MTAFAQGGEVEHSASVLQFNQINRVRRQDPLVDANMMADAVKMDRYCKTLG